MADINKPKEFLTELLQTVDSFEADNVRYGELEKKAKELTGSHKSMMKAIEKEKSDTASSRRGDVESGFDKQLKAINNEIKSVQDKRQKALKAAMKKKTEEDTKWARRENEEYKDTLKDYVKTHKLPGILKRRMYYSVFCPNPLYYILYIAVFVFVIVFAIANIRTALASEASPVPFIIVLAADIAIFIIYILIWANTRVKYRDEIKNCLDIVKNIRSNEKSVKKIEKGIKKGGDNYPEELGSFDKDIESKTQKARDIEQSKKQALKNFDDVTVGELNAEIDRKHEADKAELEAMIVANDSEMKAVKARLEAAENRLNAEFVSYVGTENLDHDRIAKMIDMLDNGTVKSITEAVSALDKTEEVKNLLCRPDADASGSSKSDNAR